MKKLIFMFELSVNPAFKIKFYIFYSFFIEQAINLRNTACLKPLKVGPITSEISQNPGKTGVSPLDMLAKLGSKF